jgi:hypothetical protein
VAGVLGYQTAPRLRALNQAAETLLLAANLLLAGAALALVLRLAPRRAWAVRAALVALALAGAAPAARALARHWHGGFARAYDALARGGLHAELAGGDPGEARICVLGYRYYPFFGSRRQFRVCRPLWLPTERALLEYLHRHDATLVVVLRGDLDNPRRYEKVPGWVLENAKVFEPVQDDPTYLVCRVRRAPLQQALVSR